MSSLLILHFWIMIQWVQCFFSHSYFMLLGSHSSQQWCVCIFYNWWCIFSERHIWLAGIFLHDAVAFYLSVLPKIEFNGFQGLLCVSSLKEFFWRESPGWSATAAEHRERWFRWRRRSETLNSSQITELPAASGRMWQPPRRGYLAGFKSC